MKEDLSPKKNKLALVSHAETIRKLNETKQYTLMATGLLEKVLTDSNLTPFAAKLWEYLYTKAVMNDTLSIRIKYKDLAEKFNRSERSVKRYVDNLKENGYLYVESNFHSHGQRANTFYLRVPDNILKSLEQTKDRNKNKSSVEISNNDKKSVNSDVLEPAIYDIETIQPSVTDKIVTPDHDINVTLNNNIKKDILLNNNNVVVDNLSKNVKADKNSEICVLHGTNGEIQNNTGINEEDKIKELEKTINNLYIKMASTTGEERIAIFDNIRKLQANISTIQIMINRKEQSIDLSTNNTEPKSSCFEINPSTDFLAINGERGLSESEIARIKKSVKKIIGPNDQHRVCNEIIYAIRFGSLKIGQNGSLLSISHAISIALKLIRERRWETPMPMQKRRPYENQEHNMNNAYFGKRTFQGHQHIANLLQSNTR